MPGVIVIGIIYFLLDTFLVVSVNLINMIQKGLFKGLLSFFPFTVKIKVFILFGLSRAIRKSIY